MSVRLSRPHTLALVFFYRTSIRVRKAGARPYIPAARPCAMLARLCLVVVLVRVFVCCDSFRPQVLKLQHDVSLRRQSLAAMQCASDPEITPRPTRPTFRVTTDAERDIDTRIMRLERRLCSIESTLHDVCSSIVMSDDVALMDRQALCIGDIYRDGSFNTVRRPRVLRQEVMRAMHKNNMNVQPLMYTWHPIFRLPRAHAEEKE